MSHVCVYIYIYIYIYYIYIYIYIILYIYIYIYRSEGYARTGYFIPVRDGMEAGEVWKFFRRCRRRRRRHSPKGTQKGIFIHLKNSSEPNIAPPRNKFIK